MDGNYGEEEEIDDEPPSPLPRSRTQLAAEISTVAERFSRKRSTAFRHAGVTPIRSIGEDAAKRLGNKQAVLIKQLVSTMKTKREMVGSFRGWQCTCFRACALACRVMSLHPFASIQVATLTVRYLANIQSFDK